MFILLLSNILVSPASPLDLRPSCPTNKYSIGMNRRLFVGVSSVSTFFLSTCRLVTAQDPPRKLEFRTDELTGVMVADMLVGSSRVVVGPDSKINIHITGRLLGKSGWIFENSQQEGEPYRLQLGTHAMVPGLERGLLGMAEGGKRRIVVPSEQGYLNKQLEPIPRDFGNRQRLYTTVMNSVRVNREREQLGSDLAGKVVFDVELLRIR